METYGIEKLGIVNPKAVYRNLTPAQLTEAALRRGEGKLSNTGALVVTTGKYTGRSPKDKFIVDTPSVHDDIAWGSVNVPITQEKFNAIRSKVVAYLQNREIFIFDGKAGADPVCTRKFRIINELASQKKACFQCTAPLTWILKLMKQQYSLVYPEQAKLLFPLILTVN